MMEKLPPGSGGSDEVGQRPSKIGRTGTVRDIVPLSVSHIVPINLLMWDSVPSKICLFRTFRTCPIVPVPDRFDYQSLFFRFVQRNRKFILIIFFYLVFRVCSN